jgi:hypothetical protein
MAEKLRPSKNKTITLSDIGITVNGKVTNVSNKRDSDTADGFVYTASTKKDNGSYIYDYEHSFSGVFAKENPITRLQGADGVGKKDMYRNIEEFRSNKTKKNEVVIDSVVSGGKGGYKGQPTESNKFRYNEGNLGDANSSPVSGKDDTKYTGVIKKGDGGIKVSFFQNQLTSASFGDQVEAVRNLPK